MEREKGEEERRGRQERKKGEEESGVCVSINTQHTAHHTAHRTPHTAAHNMDVPSSLLSPCPVAIADVAFIFDFSAISDTVTPQAALPIAATHVANVVRFTFV